MSKTKYYAIFLLFFSVLFSCTVIDDNNTDSAALKVLYNNRDISSDKNIFIIYLPNSEGISDVGFTLEVEAGATLSYDNKDLLLNEYNQYATNMDFSDGVTYDFTVTAQDGNIAIYTVRVQLMDSKEIFSFTFRETDHSHLKADIAMDIDANSQAVSKTVTNVEGITQLIPTIVYNGLSVSPASEVARDFSTNNTYTVTAIDGTTSDYTVILTSYYGVAFNGNGGLIGGDPTVVTEYVLYGEKAFSPSDPSREHYGFKGWYDAITGGSIFDFNTPITTQTTIYAQWTNKQYQVRFYQGTDLLGTVPVASLTAIPAINYPVSSEGKAYEWYSDSSFIQAYDEGAQVTNNLNLYAKALDVDGTFKSIIENEVIPSDLTDYDDMSKMIFSYYTGGVEVEARYVKETESGNGDGSSWNNASGDIQAIINGINDANNNKIYIVLIASGIYKPSSSYAMKNYVALVGGFTSGSYDRVGETRLDGDNNKQVFNNSGIYNVALLYGVVIINGNNKNQGGGMYNWNSSPTLVNVIFSGNEAGNHGGGMYNSHSSSPTLVNVTFSDNTANDQGGGMYNQLSSPTLVNVTFSGNEAGSHGGGMYSWNSSSPILNNVTFSGNEADSDGGGMYNYNASSILINVTFSGNTVTGTGNGGGIYHNGEGKSLTLINTILWNNNNGNIFVMNDNSKIETVELSYSLIEEGVDDNGQVEQLLSIGATGIRLYNNDISAYPISIDGKSIIKNDPRLGSLANNGGEVDTISIGNGSPAQNAGIYMKSKEKYWYYSDSGSDNDWFRNSDLTSRVATLPSDAKDITATDARGYSRVGRPDMGAYEKGGTVP